MAVSRKRPISPKSTQQTPEEGKRVVDVAATHPKKGFASAFSVKRPSEVGCFDSLLASNPDKRKAEIFFWKWQVVWILWFAGIVVFKTYENFTPTSYMKVGIVVGLPPIILPLLFPKLSGEEGIVWYRRYTTRLNLYNFIFSFIGNYWWTHYFYVVLGTSYTFPGHCLNGVPFALYLITHSYFLLYHCANSMAIRAFWRGISGINSKLIRYILCVAFYLFLGYSTALMEVASISSFPYYTYPDTYRMWVIGSIFYAIDFVISYPLFTYLDDDVKQVTDVNDSRGNSLMDFGIKAMACGMATSFLLDAWRLKLGNVNPEYQNMQHAICVPWTEWDW